MKTTKLLWVVLSLIFVVVFNVIIFLTVRQFTKSFWISYAFIHFAYFMLLISSFTLPKVNDWVVFGYPLTYISTLYFIVEFLLGAILMLFKDASFNAVFIPQFILAAIYGFLMIFNMIGNKESIAAEKESARDIFYIKNAAAELNMLMSQVSEPVTRKKLEKLYDAIRSSQVKSHPALAGIEGNIMVKVETLKNLIMVGELDNAKIVVDEMLNLVAERNSKITLLR